MLFVNQHKTNTHQMIQLFLGISLLLQSCLTPDTKNSLIHESTANESIHEFSFQSIDGTEKSFSEFAGKKILVVNSASKCGYTKQYADLEQLYQAKKDKLVIVAFPSNSFLQEYKETEKIQELCQKYEVSFIVASPLEVRGRNIHPIFDWLISQSNPDFTGPVEWNFEKFLIDENGKLMHRYRSRISPLDHSISSLI